MKCTQLSLGLALAFWSIFPLAASPQAGNEDQAAQYAAAGQQALAQGHFAEAQADFEKLAKLDPGVAEIHATLGAIYFKQGMYELAVKEVQTAQKLKPSLPRLDNLLGLSLAELNRFSEALPRLEKCFKQSATPIPSACAGCSFCAPIRRLNRDSDAVETALALNRLYPDDPEILYHTGRIYGNFAYIVMEKLHDKAPGSIWMLQAQGEANESQKAMTPRSPLSISVLRLDPQRPGIHYRLGRVYLARFREAQKAEDHDAAVREFDGGTGGRSRQRQCRLRIGVHASGIRQSGGGSHAIRTPLGAFSRTLKRRLWAWEACCSTAMSRSWLLPRCNVRRD